MKTLYLPVKGKYFEQIKSGEKQEEYRLYNEYWERRLVGRDYDDIVISLGYPPRDDSDKRIQRPYLGYEVKSIRHPEWNNEPRKVFAINLGTNPEF